MKVIVDQDRCVGAGQCVLITPEVFDHGDEEGAVVLLQERPPAQLGDTARQVARLCPGLAIQLGES